MSEEISAGTGKGLVTYLGAAAKRGDLAPATASAQRAAVVKVLEIEPDPDNVDIRTIDVDDLLDRFARLKGMNYQPDSLATYRSRFKRAVKNYRSHLDDPSFRPGRTVKIRRSKPRADESTAEQTAPDSSATGTTITTNFDDHLTAATAADSLVRYPFPLKMGGTAYIQVPRQITRGDVDRLVGFLNSLVIEDEPRVEPVPAPRIIGDRADG